MSMYADKTSENKSQAIVNNLQKQEGKREPEFQYLDNRREGSAQRKMQETINCSPQIQQLRKYQVMANNSSSPSSSKENLEKEIQQRKSEPIQQKDRNTDLTDHQRSGVENLSGLHVVQQKQVNPTIQMRRIPNLTSLKQGIKESLDIGDPSRTISKPDENIKKLTQLYLPGNSEEARQSEALAKSVKNVWREEWFDRVDNRVTEGSQRTIGDAQFWAEKIKNDDKAEHVEVSSIELLGDELHDSGLGPAKVWFLKVYAQSPPSYMVAIIKPEDRSIEKAILGSDDSIAETLNQKVSWGRKVNTLNMDTDSNHGTIVEFVSSSISSMVQTVLRKFGVIESEDTVNVETIGLALLTGLYDLHHQNVMKKGSAPVLIDADVAARPEELESGPSHQGGFTTEQTKKVEGQIKGDRSGASQILQYAIDHPKEVIDLVTHKIGENKARIVPIHTSDFAIGLQIFVLESQEDKPEKADEYIEKLASGVQTGINHSPGLIKEVGEDKGNSWNIEIVKTAIKADFDKGVIPHFQYQPSTGKVFLHHTCIWQGKTLAESMEVFKKRLEAAK